jgi:hypothetical protein
MQMIVITASLVISHSSKIILSFKFFWDVSRSLAVLEFGFLQLSESKGICL